LERNKLRAKCTLKLHIHSLFQQWVTKSTYFCTS